MMAFKNNRLASGSRSQAAASSSVASSAGSKARPAAAAAATHSAGHAKQAQAPKTGGSKKRDALFAVEGEEDDDDDEEEEEKAPAPQPARSSSKRGRDQRDDDDGDDEEGGPADASKPKKKSRSAPEELGFSRRPVGAGVIVTALPQFNVEKKRRDPRFDPLCGDYDPAHFHSHYTWLNDEKNKEIDGWRAEISSSLKPSAQRKSKAPRLSAEEIAALKDNIARNQQAIALSTREQKSNTLMHEWKRGERAAQKGGKGAFFLKKSEAKKLELASRFLELKDKKGALNKFMQKKTKEIKNRDHKYMPREGSEE